MQEVYMKHVNESNLNQPKLHQSSLLEYLLNDTLGLLDNYTGDDVIPSAVSPSGTASHDELQELQQLNAKSRKKKLHEVMLRLYESLTHRPSEGVAKMIVHYLQGDLDSSNQAYNGEINIKFSSDKQ
jgi:hypothetical protein